MAPPRSTRLVSLSLAFALAAGCSAGGGPEEPVRPEGVALCYTPTSSEHPATAALWDALAGGHPEDRDQAIASLEAAAEEHPEQEEFALLLGLAHLWRIAEPLPEEEGDAQLIVESAQTAQSELERAYEICPTDHRIPAWLGPLLVRMGRITGDQDQVDRGLEILQQGIEHYPAFVLFSKLLVYAELPASDPDFQMAVEAVEENLDDCAGDGPLGLSSDPACSNHPRAYHNLEGGSVFLGDVFAKAGRRDRALEFYQQAKEVPAYPSWDWQDLLEDRIATIDDRVSRYQNDDPDDNPDSIWNATFQCSLCHRE